MPDDIVKEVLGGALRWLLKALFEILFEGVIRGTGALLLRCLRPHRPVGENASIAVGLLFWVIVAVALWWSFVHVAAT